MPNHRARRNDGFYFVVVDGVPQYCQWQELKDYLRESAKVRPGHTNVVKVNEDGTRVGFCPLPTKTEANRAFEYLVAEGWRGLDIRVSLVWKSDLGSDQIERRRGPEQSRRRRLPATTHLPFPSTIPRQSPATIAYDANTSFHTSPYSMGKIQSVITPVLPPYYQFTSNYDHSPSHSMSGVSMHPHSVGCQKQTGSWGMRYTSQPSIRNVSLDRYDQTSNADHKTIHLSRLPCDINDDDLLTFLQRSGRRSPLDMQIMDQQCSASVRFHSAAQASLAVQELNGQWWGNRRVVVQHMRPMMDGIDSEGSSTSKGSDSDSSGGRRSLCQSGPLIVNGARGPGYSKRRKRDDDSASLDDVSSGEEGCSCDRQADCSHA